MEAIQAAIENMPNHQVTGEEERLLAQMNSLNRKFTHACQQIMLINNNIRKLQCRYERAQRDNQRSFRYCLRMRIATLEQYRLVYYNFLCEQEYSLAGILRQLSQGGLGGGGGDEEDEDEEEDEEDEEEDMEEDTEEEGGETEEEQ